ncbi:MAG TPA: hypothetical protein DCM73_00505, partial [Clostridiales bacterium]|nr:hypothetical protein [Clostridiales bacterium]
METVRKFPDCLLFVDEYYVALNPVIFQLLFALFILSVRVQSVNWVKATLIMVYPIEFSCFNIPANEFPGKDSLGSTFEQCRLYSEAYMKNKDTSKFFERASKIIQGNTIPMIRISDFNTLGLTGSDRTDEILAGSGFPPHILNVLPVLCLKGTNPITWSLPFSVQPLHDFL